MDLNRKYSDYQREVIRASFTHDRIARERHLDRAVTIAGQIADHQTRLGAAAAGAWRAVNRLGSFPAGKAA